MNGEPDGPTNASFRGVHAHEIDFSGAVLRGCNLDGVTFSDAYPVDINLSGELVRVIINDVDVTGHVEAELDRRHPERVLVRDARASGSVANLAVAWAELVRLWAATIASARASAVEAFVRRVGGEWSLVETLRHLVYAIDAWIGSTVLDLDDPYHRFALPNGEWPAGRLAQTGIDLEAGSRATTDEVVAAWNERATLVTELLARLDDADLAGERDRPPAPGYPERTYLVGRCIGVVLGETCEHRRYVERDLALIHDEN